MNLIASQLFAFGVFASTAIAQTCGGFEVFPDTSSFSSVRVAGVSGDGETLFGWFFSPSSIDAATWTRSGDRTILDRTGYAQALALASNRDGSVIVGSATSNFTSRPVRWTTGGAIEELLDSNGASVRAFAIRVSDDGNVVVGRFDGPGAQECFRWTAAGGLDTLLDASGATLLGTINDMSADGATVIGNRFGAVGSYIWTPSTGAVPIDDFFGMPGITFFAEGISADGSTIVGNMAQPGFQGKPFLWTAATGVIDAYPGQTLQLASFSDVNEDGTLAVGWERAASDLLEPLLWAPEVGVQRLAPLGFGGVDTLSLSEVGGLAIGRSVQSPFSQATVLLQLSPVGATYCVGSPANSTGCFGRLRVEGSALLSASDLTLRGTGLPPGGLGLFAIGTGVDVLPMPGGNQGTLCLGGSLSRLVSGSQLLSIGTDGAMSQTLDLTDLPGGIVPQVGSSLYFQGWYREPSSGGGGANFTDAVAVTLR